MDPAYIGIDLGGSFIKGVLISAEGKILAEEKTATERENGIDHVLDRIAGLVNSLVDSLVQEQPNFNSGGSTHVQQEHNSSGNRKPRERGGNPPNIAAVGVGIPGMLDASREHLFFAPNLEWRDIELRDKLADKLGLPVFLENDANVAALGEAWLGAGRDKSCFLLITVGTGIGSGLILNNKLFTGVYGLAAEIGHMTIVPHGPICSCGRKGCLETLVSAPAIFKGAQEAQIVSQGTDVREVLGRANRGDARAALVVDEAIEYLAIGLKNCLVLLDLDLILIGGGVGDSLGMFMEILEQKTLALLPVDRKVTIKGASLGNQAGALGAARLGMLGIANENESKIWQ